MRQLDAGQMAEQHAMGVQRALRRPGGAGGIDHHRRIVGVVATGREIGGRAREHCVKIRGTVRRSIDRQDEPELRQCLRAPLRASAVLGHW